MGFLDNMKNRSTTIDALRPDLQECAGKLTGNTLRTFLTRAGSTGASPPPEIPETETFWAVIPSTRRWEEGDYRYEEYGALYLTSERLFWRTGDGGFEVDLTELSVGGLRKEQKRWSDHLHIGIGPSSNPSYDFDFGDRKMSGTVKDGESYDFFLETLKAAVKEASKSPTKQPESGPSAADEIAKFAKLRNDGVITDDEFAAKKAELLGS